MAKRTPSASTKKTKNAVETGKSNKGNPVNAPKSKTEKRHSTILLTDSKYRAIIEHASDALFIHDLNGRIIEVNDKACKSLGYTKEELLKLKITDIEQNFDLQSARKEWARINNGVNFTIQGRHKRKDGEIFPVEVRFGIFSHSGETYIIGFAKEVTDEINAEERIKRTDERYRLTLDTMLEGAQIIGFDWKYLYLNEAAKKHSRAGKQDFSGKVFTDVWKGIENTELYSKMKKCMYERIPEQFENKFVFPDGSESWYELSIQPVPEGIFLLTIDITERKIAEENFRESREQFYGLYEASKEAILLTIPDGKVLAANDRACRMFQMTEEEIIGIGREGLVDMTDPRLPGLIGKRRENNEAAGELTFKRKDGTKFEGEISSAIFHDSKGNIRSSMIIRDISERKEMELRLKESENHFRTLADSGKALIWTSGTDGKCDYFNKHWLDFTGRKLEQETGDGWTEGVHPDDFERCVGIYTKAFEARENFSMEYRIRHNSGEYKWILDEGCPRYNSNGEFAGYIGYCLDVTESKEAVERLRDSEGRFRNIYERSSFGMVIVNQDLEFIAANKAFCEMTGYKEEELKSLTVKDVTHPDDYPNYAAGVPKLLSGELPVYETEKRYIKKDGKIMWTYLTALANFSSDGRFLYIIATSQDITERKLAEDSLRILTEWHKFATDAAKVGIWDWDVKKDVLKWDDTMYELFGIEKESYPNVYEAWLKGLHPEDRERIDEIPRKAAKGEKLYDSEYRIIWPDGSVHWLKTSGKVFKNENGVPVRMAGVNYDITERKKSEFILLESEKKYRYLFENNPLPMWIYDIETLEFLEVNEAAVRYYGYTRSEFLNMTLNDIRPAEDIDRLLEDVENTVDEINFAGEWRHKKKTGEIFHVEIISHLIDYNNRPARMVLANDITERIRTRDELVKNEERFRQIAETSGVWVWEVDKEGMYTYVNEIEKSILGYPVDEIVGKKHFYDFFAPEVKDSLTKAALEVFEKRQIFVNFQNPNLHKDGHIVYLETSGLPMYDNDGNFAGYRGADRDITQAKLAEEKIKKFSRALEQSPATVIITDLKGNIEYVNPKFTEVTGYTPDEVIGKNPRILKGGSASGVDYENLWNKIKEGGEWSGEFFNVKKNGDGFWVSASISPVKNGDGSSTHYLAVEEDITEKKNKELELVEAKNKAEEMNRLKSSFLSNMSHELRTPMVAILGFSEILLNICKETEAKEYADMVYKGATRLMETLNLILNLSLIEAEKLNLEKSRFDLAKDIAEMISLFGESAGKKNLSLNFDSDTESALVFTDRIIVREVMTNILNNAIKFTETGGVSVRLNTKNLKDNRFYEVRVRDTGIGIPRELRDVIFEEYRQVSEGYSRSFEGTGLGLTITKKFIDKIGGDIVIEESGPETGTVFLITIPVEELLKGESAALKEKQQTQTVEKSVASDNLYDILYVEDDEMSVSLIEIYLKKLCRLDAAENGTECLAMARKKKYDAVLVDINLGRGANGLETAAELKEMPGYENIPIIAVTAFAMEGDKEEFLEKGCTHYISKPFRREDLISIIKEALQNKKA